MRVRRLFRRALRSVLTLHVSSEAIALGVAVGMFVAFTPTIGVQMVLAAFIATLLGANRPAAVIPPWITNPLTIPPIYALTYWVGTFFWPGPSAATVRHRLAEVARGLGELSFYAFHKRMGELLKLGADVFVPMLIGGVIVGVVAAGISYPLVLWAVRRFRARRARRKARRAAGRRQAE